ncbi:MAG: glycosyltransferase [Anaerolineaceae bacterium]
MKIVCISTSTIPAPTAHSMQLMKVCQALTQLGNEVELVVPGHAGSGWKAIAGLYGLSRQFNILRLKSWRPLRRYDFSVTSVRYARQLKADLVYTWLLPAAVIALWSGLPVVLELHDRIMGTAAPWFFKLFMRSRGKKRLVVITHALDAKLKQTFNGSYNSLDVLVSPNGVEFERYSGLPSPSAARKKLDFPDRLTVVYTGCFYEGRGIELLHALARQHPDVQFIWTGGAPQSVKEWQEKLTVEGLKNVLLPGFIDNERLPMFQAAGDILVMPFGTAIAGSSGGNSAEICSPMKMFDYLASGRAIMASDLPVLHEVLNDRNAVLLPPEDSNAWSKALTRLQADKKLRQRLAKQAREDARMYEWSDREAAILKGFITP